VKLHRVAKLFPDMTTVQFDELVEDIRKNGQIEPILVCSGKIADGHHRYKACQKLKLKPKTVKWEEVRPNKDASLVDYVIARNLRRRHLTKSQRAAIATEALPLYEAEAKAKMKRAGAQGGKASKRGPAENKGPAKMQDPYPSEEPETKEEKAAPPAKKSKKAPKNRASESTAKAAKQAGVSPRYVADAAAIKKKSPALYKLVESGAVAIPLAKKMADLDKPHLNIVLREGKKQGYKQALDSFLEQFRPGTEEPPSQRDLVTKLKRATKQSEALNVTLLAAVEMAKKLKIEKGQGLINLIELTATSNKLAKQIAGD
jgi:ParB-like chromosome segregation protein Spo0J